ncbi:LysR family transcriptional regulator [Roseateles chitinivorans]|uniref:LysR family transcriptional regulator n=1 Tax=Roseateles chitinivorans TaxID=2917965 RepID=UPI003D67605D
MTGGRATTPVMGKVPLHFLPTFVAIAEHGSVRAAARALPLTHSAISQQLLELEMRLGFQVFDRRAGRLVLNAAGEVLLHSTRQALAGIDEGVHRAAGMARQTATTLKLTMPVAFAQRWFLPRLGRWYERHPDILVEVDASPQMRDLQHEGFHAAIRSSGTPRKGLAHEPLYDARCRMFAVAAPAVAARLSSATPEALNDERLLGAREEWRLWFEAAGVAMSAEAVPAFNSLTLLLNAAEQGLGIGLAREFLVVDALRRGTLRPLFGVTCLRGDVAPYALVHRSSGPHGPALAALRDWLAEEAASSLAAIDEEAGGADSPSAARA